MEPYHWQGLAIVYGLAVLIGFVRIKYEGHSLVTNLLAGGIGWLGLGLLAITLSELVERGSKWLE